MTKEPRAQVSDDEVPEADASEQRQPATPEPDIEPVEPVTDVPAADALEQAQPVRPTAWLDPPRIAPDVPEADALDQARGVPLDEDDEGYDLDDDEDFEWYDT
ncbi:MAG TPA: hypothetical protein VF183_06810 [Acidimicrobiales bacterium]